MNRSTIVGLAWVLSGCGLGHRNAPAPVRAMRAAHDSLIGADAARADSVARLGYVDGTLSWLSDDAAYLRGGAPTVYGREGVRSLLAATVPPPGAALRWQPLGGALSLDGGTAYTFGVAAVAVAVPGAAPTIRLHRYIAFWRRSRTNGWRVEAYVEVGAPPAAVTGVQRTEVTQSPHAAPVEALLSSLRAADAEFSDLAGQEGLAVAFSSNAAPDAVVFSGPELVIGPAAIRRMYESQTAGGSLAWEPVYAGVAGSGDLGFTIGNYVLTDRGPTGAAVQRFGKYLTVWKKQPNGRWKFVVDGGNQSPPPARTTGDS
jgi:ketosteroid isomerase-like protein